MERPAVSWYTRGLNDITSEYSRMLNGLGMVNIMLIKRVDLPAQVFDEQKAHREVYPSENPTNKFAL